MYAKSEILKSWISVKPARGIEGSADFREFLAADAHARQLVSQAYVCIYK